MGLSIPHGLYPGRRCERQQQDIDQAVALGEDYKRRKASTPQEAY
jgi:hypothetical protein